MIRAFDALSKNESELLLKAPILVCILIAGADGTIDRKEIQGAIETTQKRQQKAKGNLSDFYLFAIEDFEDKLKIILQNYPKEPASRNAIIEKELAQINLILPKLDRHFAIELYSSFKEISMKIATSSGGILGMNTVGDEEVKYVELTMINNPASA